MKPQKWNYSREDDNTTKCETSVSQRSPCMFGPQEPINPNPPRHFPPPYAESIKRQQMQHVAMQEKVAPTAEVKISLFHWQVQCEAQRVGVVSHERLNMQDADGDTYLHIAVAQGRRALAYVLAAKMAKCGTLDIKEHNGQTALQIATVADKQLIVHDLLAHGAQINTCDSWGRSPLHVCAEKGHIQCLQTIWRSTIGSGQPIDIEMCNYNGLTPLHAAVRSHNAAVKELRSQENPHSYAAAELAQKKQMLVECIQTLLLMGASLAAKDLKGGQTCLHIASEQANVELLQVFFAHPLSLAVVNVKTFSGNTALHIVSSLRNRKCKSQLQAVRLLLRKGADPGTRNFEKELPSHLVPEGPIGEKMRQILKGNVLVLK